LLLLFCFNLSLASPYVKDSLKKEVTLLIDSSIIEVKKPDSLIEKKLFSEDQLQYKTNVKYEAGILERFMDWLSELIFGNNNYENIYLTRQIILWTVIIISIGVVIWLLLRSDFSKLVRPESKLTTFNFNEITEDLSTINFDKMIEEAFQNGDYRLAIRWYYLRTLFVLEKGKYLVFQPSKTNIDYKNDLKKTNFQNEFMALSKIYEYVWYGKFEIDLTKYNDFKKEFNSFDSLVNVQGQQ